MQSKPLTARRNPGADIVRCLAFFLVVSVHFFYNNGYYDTTVAGEKMYVMTLMRSFFIICVPLFMMLSGYLMRTRKPEVKYYKKLGSTYLVYLLAALCCVAYAVYFLDQEWSVKRLVFGILGFTAAPYAWYVEMYLGLFLLIPFLNILYNHIPTQRGKKLLLLTLLLVTALPSVVNVYDLTQPLSWWAQPSASRAYTKLLPAWWTRLYPLTYYFLGCYVSEYGIKIKPVTNLLLILGTWLASGSYTYWRSQGSTFIWGDWCDYPSIFNVVLTTLVFVFIVNRNYEKCPAALSGVLQWMSGLCFGGYLVSWIFDKAAYGVLNQSVPHMPDRLGYYFVVVPAVFIASLLLSLVVTTLAGWIEKGFSSLFSKHAKE